jgi:hypothetical protein
MKASPPLCSTKKNRTFRAIKAYVNSGNVLREESSSPIGNIRLVSFYYSRFLLESRERLIVFW